MREVPRRVRWPVVGAAIVAASLVLLVPPMVAGALDGVAAPGAGPPPVGPGAGRATAGEAAASPDGPGTDDASVGVVRPGKSTLTYCDEGGSAETLDVYEPTPLPTGPVPTVVYIHGGGWTGGNASFTASSLVGLVASTIEALGWVVVSINYRLAPRFPWPAPMDDATCAVRFLRAHATALHVDRRHIGAIGASAGGQMAALLGLTGSHAGFDGGQYGERSSAVQAVVDLYGPADLTAADWASSPSVQAVAPHVFGTILGSGRGATLARAELMGASPVTYVGPDKPPFLIMQGDDDTIVPPGQSVELADRLRASGNSPTLVMVPGAQHEFVPVTGGDGSSDVRRLATDASDFLVRNLGPGRDEFVGKS